MKRTTSMVQNKNTSYYNIADHYIKITFPNEQIKYKKLINSFLPFAVKDTKESPLFHLIVKEELQALDNKQRERFREFDTGNGKTMVDFIKGGGYQFLIKDTEESRCCLLQVNHNFTKCHCMIMGDYDMMRFGLNNAIMMCYSFAGCFHQTLLLHASVVRHKGLAYAFTAKSGTGKSTQVSMWLKHIEDCDLLNDDNPVIRIINNEIYVYGSPWSGKTPCYRNIKSPLGELLGIGRANENRIEQLKPLKAFATLLVACPTMKWDKVIFGNVCDTIGRIIELKGVKYLHCLPNKEAAILCKEAVVK